MHLNGIRRYKNSFQLRSFRKLNFSSEIPVFLLYLSKYIPTKAKVLESKCLFVFIMNAVGGLAVRQELLKKS